MTVDKQKWIAEMAEIQKNTAIDFLEIEVIDVSDDFIRLTMPITDKVRQPMGILHGGINMVLAETAASLHACWGVDLSKFVPVGIEINGSHVKSAKDGIVEVIGTVIKRTNRFIFHQVEIQHAESGDLLSTGRVTNYYKEIA